MTTRLSTGVTDEERFRSVGIAVAIAVVATLLPFHRGLSFPFALDDYSFLYQVSGLEPSPFSLRRWLAVHGWYALLYRLFGPEPRAWHVGSFALHVANAVWVFALARRYGASRPAGWIACGLFAASPLAFSVVYWAAGIQEVGSTFFVLAAAWIAGRTGRTRWLAVPLFALAMLCKESVLLAPLALAVLLGRRGRLLSAAMFAAGIAVFVASGLHHRMLDSNLESPYATAYDSTLLVNLATLWIWFLSPWRPYPDRLAAPQPALVLPALATAGALVVYLAFTRGRHARSLGLASLWFVVLLLPVLPLRQHTYAYYAYLSQAGFLVLAGAGLEKLARRGRPASFAWLLGLGVVAVAASILCAARTARTHETLTLPNNAVPHDSVVRYGRAAGALVAAVRDARLPAGVDRVVFMSLPQQLGKAAQTPGEKRPGMVRVRRYPVRESYRDGKLMALYYPRLRSAWVDSLSSADEGQDTALFFSSGFADLTRLPGAADGLYLQAQGRYMVEEREAAQRDLERALQLSPDHPAARLLLAVLKLEASDRPGARALIRDLQTATVPAELRDLLRQIQSAVGLAADTTRAAPR